VLDASVAAKWFLPSNHEPLAAEAHDLLREYSLGNCHLIVPELFWCEVGNILWMAVRKGQVSRGSAESALKALEALAIHTLPCLPLLGNAMAIALAYDRSVYDSTYVALAAESHVPLLTADERLVNALSSRFPIRWLGALT
jgi:predicted nucleic acid-binding protein